MQANHDRMSRAGMSLVELLVVMGIILVLAALSVGIVRGVIETRRQGNTEATMRIVTKALLKQWNEVADAARKETVSPAVLTLAGGDQKRAQVIWVKMRLLEAFPQRFAEVVPTGTPPVSPAWHAYVPNRKYATYQRALAAADLSAPDNVQSSSCLLMALGSRRGSAGLKIEDLGPAVGDTNNDGVKELIDGWNRPIEFIRFPVGNDDLQSKSPVKSGYCDPLDSEGMLLTASWANPNPPPTPPALSNRQVFENICHVVSFNNAEPRLPPANYIVPILRSSGSNADDTKDDILSYSLGVD